MKKTETWLVGEEFADLRIDQAISEQFNNISRNVAQNMLKNKEILVNNKKARPSLKLKGGEKVYIVHRSTDLDDSIKPTALNFPIIFEDEHILVINKPSGLVVHPGAGREKETVVSALMSHTKLAEMDAPMRPGVVHRLDKETSGVMVLAKTEAAHKGLSKAFAQQEVEKWYTALVAGQIVNKKGRIEVAIERDKVHRKRMKATPSPNARMAISLFEVEKYLKNATLVNIQILTGRTHQIRVHMAFTKHPLIADTLYGGRVTKEVKEHLLHSKSLGFEHPVTKENMMFEAPLPKEFKQSIELLGK